MADNLPADDIRIYRPNHVKILLRVLGYTALLFLLLLLEKMSPLLAAALMILLLVPVIAAFLDITAPYYQC